MAEYIEREALCQDIESSVVFSARNAPSAEMQGANKIMERIKLAPAADVAPKVNGRCDYCKDGRSFIGQTILIANDGKCHTIHYCPNCGAKMDAEPLKGGDTNEKEK